MLQLLDKIYNNENNGLYLINTPTGSAKSYTAVKIISKYCKSLSNQRFFL